MNPILRQHAPSGLAILLKLGTMRRIIFSMSRHG